MCVCVCDLKISANIPTKFSMTQKAEESHRRGSKDDLVKHHPQYSSSPGDIGPSIGLYSPGDIDPSI